MTSILNWLLLPVRAPMLTLLGAISFCLGAHWGFQQDSIRTAMVGDSLWDELFWAFALLQVSVLVFFCTLPDLVFRQISLFMAASKVITLVVTLLLVVLGGMYLLYMPGFVDLLVLAAALLLARLDLVRLNIWPPSWVALLGFTGFIMFFVVYGHAMHLQLFHYPLVQGLVKLGSSSP